MRIVSSAWVVCSHDHVCRLFWFADELVELTVMAITACSRPLTGCNGGPVPVIQIDVVTGGIDVVVDQYRHIASIDHLRHHVLARFQRQSFRVVHAGILNNARACPVAVEIPDITLQDARIMPPHHLHLRRRGRWAGRL
ncbi:MAG: hypothetical protein ACYTDW_21650 [Planctomycetota bacterium]